MVKNHFQVSEQIKQIVTTTRPFLKDLEMDTYEKKYNEALERARNLMEQVRNNELLGFPDQFTEIFPELRENEDERVRKVMVKYFKELHEQSWINLEIPDILAWLEKQKYDRMKPIYDERESFESALEKAWNDYHNGYENVDKLEDDYVECAHAKGFREGYLFGIEKQKEQKPVHTAKEMWKEMRLEVYAQASGNRHEPNYSDDSTKMFSLCDIDEIFEKIGSSTVGSHPAEWMAGHGWHDVTETPSIFGFYLVIHEKGWCVANYMGKGIVCESGWVEAIHHIEIEHPKKWLDLRDFIPKKQ